MFQLGFGWFWAAKIEGWSCFSRKCLAIPAKLDGWLDKNNQIEHIISAPMGLRASHFGPYPLLATHSRASHSPISTPTDGPISSHGSLLSKHGQNTASCARKSTNWSPLSSHDAHLVGNVGQPRGEGRQTHVSFPFGWPQKGTWTLKASHETQPYPISYW